MKKITLIAAFAIALISCEKEDIKIDANNNQLRVKSKSSNFYTLDLHKRHDYLFYHNSPKLKLYNDRSFSFGTDTGIYSLSRSNLSLNRLNYEILIQTNTDLVLSLDNDTLIFSR